MDVITFNNTDYFSHKKKVRYIASVPTLVLAVNSSQIHYLHGQIIFIFFIFHLYLTR
jgi:hypothetical protein